MPCFAPNSRDFEGLPNDCGICGRIESRLMRSRLQIGSAKRREIAERDKKVGKLLTRTSLRRHDYRMTELPKDDRERESSRDLQAFGITLDFVDDDGPPVDRESIRGLLDGRLDAKSAGLVAGRVSTY